MTTVEMVVHSWAVLLPNRRARLSGVDMSLEKLQERLELEYRSRAERVLFLDADPRLGFEDFTSAVDEAHTRSEDLYVGLITSESRRAIYEQRVLPDCIRFARDPRARLPGSPR